MKNERFYEFSGVGFWLRVNKSIRKKWFTQDLVAQRLGMNAATFRGWSYRKQFPDIVRIYKMAEILGESFNYLVFGADGDPATTEHIKLGKHLYPFIMAIKDVLADNVSNEKLLKNV